MDNTKVETILLFYSIFTLISIFSDPILCPKFEKQEFFFENFIQTQTFLLRKNLANREFRQTSATTIKPFTPIKFAELVRSNLRYLKRYCVRGRYRTKNLFFEFRIIFSQNTVLPQNLFILTEVFKNIVEVFKSIVGKISEKISVKTSWKILRIIPRDISAKIYAF